MQGAMPVGSGDLLGGSIYDETNAPPEFVRSFIWWAYHKCPNQQYTTLECGAREPVFKDSHLSPESLARIAAECDEFWSEAKSVIRSSKGRCNWHPSVDTNENHVGNCGSNFFFARQGDVFFMEGWPELERSEFRSRASKFCPMFLQESNGRLEYHKGLPPNDPKLSHGCGESTHGLAQPRKEQNDK